MNRLFILFVVFLCSCQQSKRNTNLATQVNHERPRAMSPEIRSDGAYEPSIFGEGQTGGDAVIAVALAGVFAGLAKITSDPEGKQRSDLRGTCVYENSTHSISRSPCINITAELLDQDKKSVVKTVTNEYGDFRFFIPSGNRYFLKVSDRKGRSSSMNQTVSRGQKIVVVIKN